MSRPAYYRRLVAALKELDILLIVDTDGDVTQLAPWLQSVGVDAVLPLERQVGVDDLKLRQQYPTLRDAAVGAAATAATLFLTAFPASADRLAPDDPVNAVSPPAHASGYPSRDTNLDALPAFQNPPPGYGEVPFWWWTGDPLDVERLTWQLDELHKKGISGVQVNYAHEDSPGIMVRCFPPNASRPERLIGWSHAIASNTPAGRPRPPTLWVCELHGTYEPPQ